MIIARELWSTWWTRLMIMTSWDFKQTGSRDQYENQLSNILIAIKTMINVDQHDCDDKVRRCSCFSALPQPCLHWSESDGYSDSDHIQIHIHHNQTAGRIYHIRTTDFNLANKCLSSHHFVPNKQTTLAASMPARTRSLPYIYPFSCQSNSIPT